MTFGRNFSSTRSTLNGNLDSSITSRIFDIATASTVLPALIVFVIRMTALVSRLDEAKPDIGATDKIPARHVPHRRFCEFCLRPEFSHGHLPGQFLEDVLSNAVLDKTTVRFELKKPLVMLAEMARSEEWRTRKDSNLRPLDS